jgi:hypothetical protein
VAYLLRRLPTHVVIGVYGLTPDARDPIRMVLPDYPVERALLTSDEFLSRYRPVTARTPSGYFVYFTRAAAVSGGS